MTKHLSILFFALHFSFPGGLSSASHSTESPTTGFYDCDKNESLSNLSITKTTSTSVSLTWSSSGTGIYRITITNLTTSQVEHDFTVSTTSASAGSLTTGHTYRFSVEQNGFVIAEDLVM